MTGMIRASCGNCRYAAVDDTDITKRICFQLPPRVFPVPMGQGMPRLLNVRPSVAASDLPCEKWKRVGTPFTGENDDAES